MRRPNARIVLGAACAAIAAIVGLSWPAHWPTWLRLTLTFTFAFLGVVLIETERQRIGAPRAPRPGPAPAGDERLRPQPELGEPLPERESFRGRETELEELLVEHARLRRMRTVWTVNRGWDSGRPVLLLIHGKPGVGKTAFAQELGRRLAGEYPDGQLYENLGYAGDPLSASEVLARFVTKLGWDKAIPPNQSDLANIFRTLTAGRRLLFVLDAARDWRQVLDLLPNESSCGVVVTSRSDLGPNFGLTSYRLGELDADDALDMLHAVARIQDLDAPDCAGEIIDRCGRLPLAVQSAGERVSDEGSDLCGVAAFLRDKSSRLDRLTRQGRNVKEGFATEYARLEPAEQRAFRLLGRVESSSFVPWVLAVMMQVPMESAGDLCARLCRAELIDYVARDPLTMLVRYRMHPLVKLYAQECAAAGAAGEDADAARRRLDLAYQMIISRVVRCLERDFHLKREILEPWYVPAESELPHLIAAHPDGWIRAEYSNLVRSLRHAYRTAEHGLCWRIGERIAGLVPEGVPAEEALAVLDLAMKSADRDPSPLAAVDMRIAKAACLIAFERYADAFGLLAQARERALVAEAAQPGPARLRQARVFVKRGEAYLQMRRPQDAEEELQQAKAILTELDASGELHLVGLLSALNFDVNLEDPDGQLVNQVGEGNHFFVLLERFEERRRRQAWTDAEDDLRQAEQLCLGDFRRQANVLYRRTRLYLERWDTLSARGAPAATPEAATLARKAVRRATETVLAFQRMGNRVGELRARCLLIRALVAAGKLTEAAGQVHLAGQQLDELPAYADVARDPIKARVAWAKAVWLDADDQRPAARQELLDARGIFLKLEDGRSRGAVQRLLNRWEAAAPLTRAPR